MHFVREDILSNLLAIENKPIESLYVELTLRNTNWLIHCSYNPHTHISKLRESLDLFSANYEKVVILGKFTIKLTMIT